MFTAIESYDFAMSHEMWYDISTGDILSKSSGAKLIRARVRVGNPEFRLLAVNVMQFGPFLAKVSSRHTKSSHTVVKMIDNWSADTFSLRFPDANTRTTALEHLHAGNISSFGDEDRIIISNKDRERAVSLLTATGYLMGHKSKELEAQELRARHVKTFQYQIPSRKKQDRVIKLSQEGCLLVAVCDGHGEDDVINYIDLHKMEFMALIANPFPTTHEEAQKRTTQVFVKFENEMRSRINTMHSGSTMVFAAHDIKTGKVFFGYIGDSRVIFQHSPGSEIIASSDHKPNTPDESKRIRSLGGFVSYGKGDTPRVNGNLATSRSFGDGTLKSESEDRSKDLVSVMPDILGPVKFGPESLYFLGSDGVFDVVQNLEVVNYARGGNEAATVASHFASLAKQRGSRDDISAAFVTGV
jgi:protein phosphatase 1L